MITWYQDDEMAIFFSDVPDVKTRFDTPFTTRQQSKQYEEKPFICLNKIDVCIKDYIACETYKFEIKKDYTWDGATIPRFLWRLFGSKSEPEFLIPSLIHDVICGNHDYVERDRYFSSCIFERLLNVAGVPAWKRCLMKHGVDNYQKIFGGWGVA